VLHKAREHRLTRNPGEEVAMLRAEGSRHRKVIAR
jgi:hypothetical protein